MLPNTKNTAEELLKLQTGAEETHNKNSNLMEREEIQNTPFEIVGNTEIGYTLIMGKYTLTEFLETKEEVLNELKTIQWKIIQRMIGAMIDFNEKIPVKKT